MSRLFGKDILKEPEVIAAVGMTGLKLAVGLGPVSLREIALALHKFGCIDDVDQWLGS